MCESKKGSQLLTIAWQAIDPQNKIAPTAKSRRMRVKKTRLAGLFLIIVVRWNLLTMLVSASQLVRILWHKNRERFTQRLKENTWTTP